MTNTIEVLMEDAVFVPAVIKKCVTNRDVRLLTKIGRAIEALHREAPKAAVLAEYPDRLHTSCVLASFTLRDMLRAIGMPAAVVPCSLAITSENEGVITNLLMIGDRSPPRTPNVFNGHLVVRVGNLLIDPTSGQAGRAWNLWYKGLICAVAHRPIRWTDPTTGEEYLVFANGGYRIPNSTAFQRWTYLRRPDLETDNKTIWAEAPDADPQRREELVRHAVETFRRGGYSTVLTKPSNDLNPYINSQVFA